ncbi:MAG TPA: MarR family transcriptional regulator [Flavobacteriaceae bacterium]|nr:MarR family transcriptional regulator [Flavobacteriaceae bacterium]
MNIEYFLKINKEIPVSLKAILNILVLSGKLKREINELLNRFGISEPQFNVLRILRGQNQPADLKTIQIRMVHKTSNTTRLVDKLLEKKLVKRNIPKENRRKVEISITSAGLELLSTVDPEFDKLQHTLVANLSQNEVQELNRILEKMNDSDVQPSS